MFLICGEALLDVYTERRTARELTLDARVGGAPFNVATGLARLQRAAALFCGLSNDFLGAHLREALAAEGVDVEFIVTKSRPTTLGFVDVGPDGSPRYAFYGNQAADRSLSCEDLPTLTDDIQALHFGSYSLVVEPTGSTLLELAKRESERRFVSLDPNVRLSVEPDVNVWKARLNELLKHADLVKVSIEDVEMLYGSVDLETLAEQWLADGPGLVVVTLGANGAVAFSNRGRIEVHGRPVNVVDTVGAGDTFMAALLCALDERNLCDKRGISRLDDVTVEDVLTFAADAAAVTCTRRGADLPRRSELRQTDSNDGATL